MNVLIVYAHPNPKSFNHAILNRTKEKYESEGSTVIIRDLYEMNFNPVLSAADFVAIQKGSDRPDVLTEQMYIEEADRIVFIFPNWWYGMPAILKGYVDRVFSFGFAYTDDENGDSIGLLIDKKAIFISTSGATIEELEEQGTIDAYKTTIEKGIFNFCGIDVIDHIAFGNVRKVSKEKLDSLLDDLDMRLK
jgi:NAD(P)H dehydrogenase (quinone)